MKNNETHHNWPIFSDDSGIKMFYPGKLFYSHAFRIPNDSCETKIRKLFFTAEVILFVLWIFEGFAMRREYGFFSFIAACFLTWLTIKTLSRRISKGLEACDASQLKTKPDPIFIGLGRFPAIAITLSEVIITASYLITKDLDNFSLYIFSIALPAGLYNLYLIFKHKSH